MTSTLQFLIKFHDAGSSGMGKFAGSARKSFNVVDSTLKNVNRHFKETDRSLRSLSRPHNININSRDLDNATHRASRLQRVLRGIAGNRGAGGGAGVGLGGIIGGAAVGYGAYNSMQTAARDEATSSAINFATGGDGANTLRFLRAESDRLGASFSDTKEGALTLFGAMKGGRLTLDKQREILTGILEAGSAFQLTGEQQRGALLAVSQMASKGVVAAEELRGQLGERIPGAFRIAAEAMGMSERKFNSYLNAGKIVADDFLPKFAARLHETFGIAAVQNATKATGQFNRMGNSIRDLKVMIGQELLPKATQLVNEYLIPGAHWLKENWTWLKHVAGVTLSVTAAVKGFTIVQAALNAVMYANPVMLVAGAVGTLGYMMYQAYGKVKWFTDAVDGAWHTLQVWGNGISDMFAMLGFTVADEQAKMYSSINATATDNKITGMFAEAGAAHGKAYANAYTNAVSGGDFSTRMEQWRKQVSQREQARSKGMRNAMGNWWRNTKEWWTKGYITTSSHNATNSVYNGRIGNIMGNVVAGMTPTVRSTPGGLNGDRLEDFNSGASDGITSGGPRVINIRIDALVKDLHFHTQNAKESAREIEEVVTESLLRITGSLSPRIDY